MLDINGVELGMFIKGRDRSDPVLLWVHGGPGMPDYFLTEQYPTGLPRPLHHRVVGPARCRAFVPLRHLT